MVFEPGTEKKKKPGEGDPEDYLALLEKADPKATALIGLMFYGIGLWQFYEGAFYIACIVFIVSGFFSNLSILKIYLEDRK